MLIDDSVRMDELVRPTSLGPLLVEATGHKAWIDFKSELIVGGKSNLTFQLTSTAGQLILRRPPSGELLPSAHDMVREVNVQRALARTDVPVPTVVLLVTDSDVLGVPFYVMEKVEGHVIRTVLPTGFAMTTADKESLTRMIAETLSSLHRINPTDIGLAGFGRPNGFVSRQVQRWSKQWDLSKSVEIAALDELASRLTKIVPVAQSISVIHGDFRIDNCIFSTSEPTKISAILDWELSSIGDPLIDLGLARLYWRGPHDRELGLVPCVTTEPGFPNRDEFTEHYARSTGFSLEELAFYDAFACFKFAVITQGVFVRALHGDMAGQDFGKLTGEVAALADEGLAYLE
jgi:aminoglycoside phosphotransferase (APT) family kinase protein